MNKKALIVLTVATVLVLALVSLDVRHGKKKKKVESESKKLIKVDWDHVASLELQVEGQPGPILLERKHAKDVDRWKIKAPVQDDVDQDTVDRLWKALQDVQADTTFPISQGMDLSPYGLAKPHTRIRIQSDTHKTMALLMIGGKAPVGGNVYATVKGSSLIYTIPGFRQSSLSPKLKDLRNRKLAHFKSSGMSTLIIERKSTEPHRVVMHKKEGIWRIDEPGPFLADSGRVYSLTSSIEFLEAQDFIEESASDLARYGLDNPSVRLTVQTPDGASQTFLFGNDYKDKEVYSKVDTRPQVVTVNKSFLDDLKKGLDEWQSKNAVDFDYYNLEEITIKNAKGRSWHLTKNPDQKEASTDAWFVGSGASKRKINLDTVEDWTRTLDYTEGQIVTDHAKPADLVADHLDHPWLIVRIKDKEKGWQTVHIGQDKTSLYTTNPAFPAVIFTFPDKDRKDFLSSWKKLKKELAGPQPTPKNTSDTGKTSRQSPSKAKPKSNR